MKKMIFALILVIAETSYARGKSFGVGAVVGNPTGLTGKILLPGTNAVDATIGFSLGSNYFNVHANYLWAKPNIFKTPKVPFDLYYGVGGRLKGATELRLGPRVPVGLGYYFSQPGIEVFAELAIVVDIITKTDVELNAGIGGRFYF